MARITIEATDVDDLQQTMLGLLAMSGQGVNEAEDDSADSPPAVRGGRRKKTSPAATAALAATAPSGDLDSSEPSLMATGSSTGPTATATASPSEPAVTGGVTKEALAEIMTRAMGATSPLISQKTLEDAGLPKRLSEIPAERYGEAADALNKLIAAM